MVFTKNKRSLTVKVINPIRNTKPPPLKSTIFKNRSVAKTYMTPVTESVMSPSKLESSGVRKLLMAGKRKVNHTPATG